MLNCFHIIGNIELINANHPTILITYKSGNKVMVLPDESGINTTKAIRIGKVHIAK